MKIMNIFVLDENPKTSARMMIDKHVVKMPTESMQMISTITNHLGFDSPYKPVMLNHPSTIWARESQDNFQWLLDHCEALCEEFNLRYDNTHSVETTLRENYDTFMKVKSHLPNIGLTPFAIAISPNMNCRKLPNFEALNTVEKYQQYYLEDKWKFASWKLGKPSWWPDDHIQTKNQEWNDWLESENERIRRVNNGFTH